MLATVLLSLISPKDSPRTRNRQTAHTAMVIVIFISF